MTSCAVADHATIFEKTSLKNCSLGTNCTVNMKTRISNSILMNGVVIEEGYVFYYKFLQHLFQPVYNYLKMKFIFFFFRVTIENCVICEKAIVRKGCVLKNCLVGPNHEVDENTNKEKVHLMNSDGYMEIE